MNVKKTKLMVISENVGIVSIKGRFPCATIKHKPIDVTDLLYYEH